MCEIPPDAQKRIAARAFRAALAGTGSRGRRWSQKALSGCLSLAAIAPSFALLAADFPAAPWLGHANYSFPRSTQLIASRGQSPADLSPITV